MHISNSNVAGDYSVRQADESSCHSEGLYYLQRALRMGSLYDNVRLDVVSKSDIEYGIFFELPDLLLTTQYSSVIAANGIDVNSPLSLRLNKNPMTFSEKTSKHNVEIEYSNQDDQTEKKSFREKGFLNHVNQKHRKILDV